MYTNPKTQVDMPKTLKFPRILGISTSQEKSIFLITAAILIAVMLLFSACTQKAQANLAYGVWEQAFIKGKLSFLGNNSLLPVSSPSGPEFKVVRKIPVVITAYSSTPFETDDTPFVTAAGTRVRDGIIANNYFSFGTKVKIPELYGEKIFTVEDRMSWKKGNYQIDIWFPSHQEAEKFGAKRTFIEILEG
jgi:3D (Asp-Asp-Asp) domain-containing protein